MTIERRIVECGACDGFGHVEVGRLIVTLDMAIDAGDRTMAGTDCGPEYGPCPRCGGSGHVEDEGGGD